MQIFELLEAFFAAYGYLAVFLVLVACGLGLPIPEDVTLVTGGVIAGLGHANVHMMLLVCMAGVLIGDGIMFTAGKLYGHRILELKWVSKIMTPRRYAQVQEKFEKYGNSVLFIARFLPGLRAPIYISAGISKRISFLRFFVMDGLAASLSVPIWVYLGDYGAENIDWLMKKIHQFQSIVWVVLAIVLVVILYFWSKRRARIRFFKETRRNLRKKYKKDLK